MAKNNAQFTVVTGRRRIGKTSLVWKAYEDEPILYFFVARKAEGDLCEDYRLEIENKLGVPTMGRAEHFTDVFEYLMKLSAERPITLFIDEFQEFFRVNKSVFSDMQRIWDLYSPKSRINLIVCGSIYSMMTKIFKDKKEPLYNRAVALYDCASVYPNCSERYSFRNTTPATRRKICWHCTLSRAVWRSMYNYSWMQEQQPKRLCSTRL